MWFARSLKAKASQDEGKGSQRVKCFLPLIWNHVMWNECFSSNCFLTLTVSWCEVKVWERWGEERGSVELLSCWTQRDTSRAMKRMGSPAASAQLGWPWWSHGQTCGTLRTSCPGSLSFSLVLPLGSGRGSHASLQNEPRVSHSGSARTQSATPVLPAPCTRRSGTPLGVLLAKFIFPSGVHLFLCNQICSVHQSAPPSAENFNLKQISKSFDFLDQQSLFTPRVPWFNFLYRSPCKGKTLIRGYHHVKYISTDQRTTFVF